MMQKAQMAKPNGKIASAMIVVYSETQVAFLGWGYCSVKVRILKVKGSISVLLIREIKVKDIILNLNFLM